MMRRLLGGGFVLALSVMLGACATSPYCLNCEDGGGGGGGEIELGPELDLSSSDLVDAAEPHPCDPATVATDPFNCGSCGNACPFAHSIPECVAGLCRIKSCDVGWVDLDGQLANDCEYACLATGAETCDGADNDCNGVIDDGFDLSVDTLNCGACGVTCTAINAVATCSNGGCSISGCIPGYADRDPLVAGCEYRCPVYPALTFEVCNGIDDDCDGDVDEAADLEAPPSTLCSTAVNTPCAGTSALCQDRGGVTTWYCNYGAGVEFDPSIPNGLVTEESKCDGADGDCDGIADDPYTGLGNECDNGLRGACRDIGVIACDPLDDSVTYCDLSVAPDAVPGAPSSELCNNVDDDCDGTPDNGIVQDMVHVVIGALDFYIDRYEASRPDATAASAGVVQARSCSKADALPWTRVSFASAQAACAAGGLRLCTADEWQAACAGAAPRVYPYGNVYEGGTCNGADFAAIHDVLPTGDASLAMCITPDGVRDLSGNVKEWTNDQQGSTSGMPSQPIYVVRGGGYGSPSIGLTCATTFSRASANTTLPTIGFRCCRNGP